MRIVIDGNLLSTPGGIHDYLQSALDYPEYYGKNADALYDLLSVDPREITFVFRHIRAMGEYGRIIRAVITDVAAARPNIQILPKRQSPL